MNEQNNPLTGAEFITLLSKRAGVSKQDAMTYTKAFQESFFEALEKDKELKISGIGIFKLVNVGARKSVDVNSGKQIEIAEHYRIAFTPDKGLKERVNEPLAHLLTVDMDEQPNEQPIDKLIAQANELVGLLSDIQGYDITAQQPAKTEKEEVHEVDSQPIEQEPVTPEESHEEIEEELQPGEKPVEIPQEPEKVEPVEEPKQQEEVAPKQEPEEEQKTVAEQLFQPAKQTADKAEKRVRKTNVGAIVAIVIVVVLLLLSAGAIAFLYQRGDLKKENFSTLIEPVKSLFIKVPAVPEEVVLSELDELPEELQPEEQSIEEASEELVNEQFDQNLFAEKLSQITPQTAIKAVEKIEKNTTLASLAFNHYGERDFWIYIYLANKDILANPNKVRVGMQVKIPEIEPSMLTEQALEYAQMAKETLQ